MWVSSLTRLRTGKYKNHVLLTLSSIVLNKIFITPELQLIIALRYSFQESSILMSLVLDLPNKQTNKKMQLLPVSGVLHLWFSYLLTIFRNAIAWMKRTIFDWFRIILESCYLVEILFSFLNTLFYRVLL